MKSLLAFFKKELLESVRGAKLFVILGISIVIGFLNPGITAITPWLMEMFSESLAAGGMQVTVMTVSAVDSWMQFFSNVTILHIAFVMMYGGIFTKEYGSTLVLVITKGLARYKIVLAKLASMLIVWTVSYWMCYVITYVANDVLWDNSIVPGVLESAALYWIFGVWTIALCVMFSTIFSNYIGVLLGTGGTVVLSYILSIIPKAESALPTGLMNVYGIMLGAEGVSELKWAITVTLLTTVLAIAASFPLMNRKEI